MEKVVVIVTAPEFTSKDFDQTWDRVRATGLSHPQGLLSHVGFENPEGGMMVVDVWESAEAFEEFSKTLMPQIQKTGRICRRLKSFLRIISIRQKQRVHRRNILNRIGTIRAGDYAPAFL